MQASQSMVVKWNIYQETYSVESNKIFIWSWTKQKFYVDTTKRLTESFCRIDQKFAPSFQKVVHIQTRTLFD